MYEEANMPIEKVMEKYKTSTEKRLERLKNLRDDYGAAASSSSSTPEPDSDAAGSSSSRPTQEPTQEPSNEHDDASKGKNTQFCFFLIEK